MTSRNRALAVVGAAAILTAGVSTAATAAGDIGWRDFNDSLQSKLVFRGYMNRQINTAVNKEVLARAAQDEKLESRDNELQSQIDDLKTRVKKLEDSNGGGSTPTGPTWQPNDEGTKIVDAHTATLKQVDKDGTALESTDISVPVQAGQKVTFDVVFGKDAYCIGGAPRVYVEMSGKYYNSADINPTGGGSCADGSDPSPTNNDDGTITLTLPENGRIGAAGIVWDNGNEGQITVKNFTVNGKTYAFQ